MMVGDGTWLSVGEAADLMGISKWKVRQMAKAGTLEATTVPDSKHLRISRKSAEAHRLGGGSAGGTASDS